MNPEVLRVRTERLDYDGPLLNWAEPEHPLAFLRGGEGIVGFGERTSFRHEGENRIADLARWWRELCDAADVHDEVKLPGTGLTAFGSFAFSDTSASASVLTVPSVIVGRRGGVTWITRFEGGFPVEPSTPWATRPASLVPGAMTPGRYEAAVLAARQHIRAGELGKVVLARDLVADIGWVADKRGWLARLAAAYPDTFTFAHSGLMGSSPETLVRVSGGDVSARVLAGTARRWPDDATDVHAASTLASSAKDRGEHDHAVRSVLDSLAPHATDVTTSDPYPLRLPNLWHLASDVHGTLVPGRTALELVGALHPTAAVAGTPTDVALELITELEPFDRGRYAGPVGWVDAAGDGEWAIALRCALIDDDGHITAWAGAGIVADSEPAKELAETELKFRPIVEAFGQAG
ncbi:MAG TPA: isochorismate synthase [Rhodoglobus sp.]|nr:isochorismate synthase [Rhodoglobus sp.]